jgi:hypothetical protein
MSKFGLYGKIVTQPGQRDALVAILLEAAVAAARACGWHAVHFRDTAQAIAEIAACLAVG